jgi:hypothetical protein
MQQRGGAGREIAGNRNGTTCWICDTPSYLRGRRTAGQRLHGCLLILTGQVFCYIALRWWGGGKDDGRDARRVEAQGCER